MAIELPKLVNKDVWISYVNSNISSPYSMQVVEVSRLWMINMEKAIHEFGTSKYSTSKLSDRSINAAMWDAVKSVGTLTLAQMNSAASFIITHWKYGKKVKKVYVDA